MVSDHFVEKGFWQREGTVLPGLHLLSTNTQPVPRVPVRGESRAQARRLQKHGVQRAPLLVQDKNSGGEGSNRKRCSLPPPQLA